MTFLPFSACLFISAYLSLLPVSHLSDAPRRRLVVTGDRVKGYRTKLPRAVTLGLGLKSHPKDN